MKNKIKKVLSIILSLVMVLSLFGCSKDNNDDDETKGTTENNETIGANQEENSLYAEDQVLFYAQNKYNLDDDRHIIHFYNYKGELLSSNDTSRLSCFSVPSYNKFDLSPVFDFVTGYCGFVNNKEEFVISPKYENVFPFSEEGLALVSCETEEWNVNVYGYINTKGEEVIPCTFDYATSFYDNGLAIVGLGDFPEFQYGVIDKNGRNIIDCKYEEIYDIEGEYILCRLGGKYNIYNLSGEIVYEYNIQENPKYGNIVYCVGENIFIRNAYSYENNEITVYIFDGKDFTEYDDTYIGEYTKIITAEESGRGCGVSYKGETVVPCEYERIYDVHGYYVAINSHSVDSFDIYNSKFEKTADNLEFEFIPEYSSYSKYIATPDGYFAISKRIDGQTVYGIIDYNGKIIVEPVFSDPIKVNTYEFSGNFMRTNNRY